MDEDADLGGDGLDSEGFGYSDDSSTADTDSSYADYEGAGDDDGTPGLMGYGVGDDAQGSGDGFMGDFVGNGDETAMSNTQETGSDDAQGMGEPIDKCQGYRAICQKHPAWAGPCRDTVAKAQADADEHNNSKHGGTPYAGVLD